MASNSNNERSDFGFTLIAIGVIWLLFKFNILNFSLFSALGHLWPLILVIAGLNLVFKNRGAIRFLTWGIFIAALIWYGQTGNGVADSFVYRIQNEPAPRDASWELYEAPVGEVAIEEGITQANLKMDLGFGGVYIDSANTSNVEYKIPEDVTNVYQRSSTSSTTVEFEQKEKLFFDWDDNDHLNYSLSLPENVEWDIDLNTGAIDANIDISKLDVRNIEIDCGAGDIEIKYGLNSPLVYTEIDSGATEITLNVPEGAGVEINMDGLLSDNKIFIPGMKKISDSIYRTDNFDEEDVKLFIEIDTGVGEVDLNRY